MRTNNKGLSLIEVIIVVAIMSVLTGIMTIGLSVVISKPAEECAKKIVSTLRDAKVTTMGKRYCYLDLSQTSESSIINITESIATKSDKSDLTTSVKKVGERNIKVTIETSKGRSFLLTEVNYVRLTYNRETGGFKYAQYKDKSGGTFYSDDYVNKIIVEKGTKSYTIKLSYLTGKVSIE